LPVASNWGTNNTLEEDEVKKKILSLQLLHMHSSSVARRGEAESRGSQEHKNKKTGEFPELS